MRALRRHGLRPAGGGEAELLSQDGDHARQFVLLAPWQMIDPYIYRDF